MSPYYQPKTGAKCSCKRGVQRDNCPSCEGTGWVIDFAAIRAQVAAGMARSAAQREQEPGKGGA
jgi:hypothetical protein